MEQHHNRWPIGEADQNSPSIRCSFMYAGRVPTYSDACWNDFVPELRKLLGTGRSSVSSEDLARELGIPTWVVQNWRKGRARPDLRLLKEIPRAVGNLQGTDIDSHWLLRRMGIIDPGGSRADLAATAQRLRKLELRLADAHAESVLLRRAEGAAQLVAEAVRSNRWAIAVWPVWEGPVDYQFHTTDRIDVRCVDGEAATWSSVMADSRMVRALRAAGATRSEATPRWLSDDDEGGRWSIPHIGVPRSPFVTRPWPGLTSIACYSISSDVWTHDFAALLAMAIGYGVSTTRDLAIEMAEEDPEWTSYARAAFEELAAHPPKRRVWSHQGALPVKDSFGGVPAIIWLRESDAYLADLARVEPAEAEHIRRIRDSLDMEAASHPEVLSYPVHPGADRNESWAQLLHTLSRTLEELRTYGLLPRDERVFRDLYRKLERDEGVGDVLVRWLADH